MGFLGDIFGGGNGGDAGGDAAQKMYELQKRQVNQADRNRKKLAADQARADAYYIKEDKISLLNTILDAQAEKRKEIADLATAGGGDPGDPGAGAAVAIPAIQIFTILVLLYWLVKR